MAEIRVGKQWHPYFFDANEPILCIRDLDSPTCDAERICGIATRLCQLSRGVDMAAATAAGLPSPNGDATKKEG